MVAMGGPEDTPDPSGDEDRQRVQEMIDLHFEEMRRTTKVTCAVLETDGDDLKVNNKPLDETEDYELSLPSLEARGTFRVRRQGEEYLVSFSSDTTGSVEQSFPIGENRLAVFRGDRFYLAPDEEQVSFRGDGSLWVGSEQLGPQCKVNLGIGQISAENHDGAWIVKFDHPDSKPEDALHPNCRAVLTVPGEYELTFVFGGLMTFSVVEIEISNGTLMINGREIEPSQVIPFHLDGGGGLWLEAQGSEVLVCYGDSMRSVKQPLCDRHANGKFKVTYNSGPGLEVKEIN